MRFRGVEAFRIRMATETPQNPKSRAEDCTLSNTSTLDWPRMLNALQARMPVSVVQSEALLWCLRGSRRFSYCFVFRFWRVLFSVQGKVRINAHSFLLQVHLYEDPYCTSARVRSPEKRASPGSRPRGGFVNLTRMSHQNQGFELPKTPNVEFAHSALPPKLQHSRCKGSKEGSLQ